MTIALDPDAEQIIDSESDARDRFPDKHGRFGEFGGRYAPEGLMAALLELESTYRREIASPAFRTELHGLLKQHANRPTPLHRLTRFEDLLGVPGLEIYAKREDLLHTGTHYMNNAVGQALLAQRMGKTRILAEGGSGLHGVAAATMCAILGLECVVYMGAEDMRRQSLNVTRIRLLGAEVRSVSIGAGKVKDAIGEAVRDWIGDVDRTHFLLGEVTGPTPYPEMVRDFHAVVGTETRRQIIETTGGLPDHVIACVGGGSHAIGMFEAFLDDPGVRLIGIEAAGRGIDTGAHAAPLTAGSPGVLQGDYSYLLQDSEGQSVRTHSIAAGIDYPTVGPELAYLKDSGRATYHAVTDASAIDGFRALCHTEGIIASLECSHAFGYLLDVAEKAAATPREAVVVVNISGRGEKDIDLAARALGL